jgi:hypothetical protein
MCKFYETFFFSIDAAAKFSDVLFSGTHFLAPVYPNEALKGLAILWVSS